MGNHPNRNKVTDWPEFLKGFRASHSLTQKDLADKLQISARNVENWESGFSKPPAYLKRALLDLEQFL
jgi:transcriptional regulator with XRE-family HTH domain